MGHNITFSTYVTIKLHICITIHLILSNPRFAPLLIVIVVGILSPPRFCHHRLVPPHPDPKHCLPSGLHHYSPILSNPRFAPLLIVIVVGVLVVCMICSIYHFVCFIHLHLILLYVEPHTS
jgi:hypothetical protein